MHLQVSQKKLHVRLNMYRYRRYYSLFLLFTAFSFEFNIKPKDTIDYPMIAEVSITFDKANAACDKCKETKLEFKENKKQSINLTVSQKNGIENWGVGQSNTAIEFTFKVNWKVDEEKISDCPHDTLKCPMVDTLDETEETELIVDLQNGCADNNACKCQLSSNINNKIFQVVVGEDQYLKIPFIVKNSGSEPGYGAKFYFETEDVDTIPIPDGCKKVL